MNFLYFNLIKSFENLKKNKIKKFLFYIGDIYIIYIMYTYCLMYTLLYYNLLLNIKSFFFFLYMNENQ